MRGWGVAGRLFLAYVIFIVIMAVFVGTAMFVDARDRGFSAAADRTLSVASTIADSPLVVTAANSHNPTASLQAYTLRVSEHVDLDFVTIMSPAGVRWTDPDTAAIGRPYTGTTSPASTGKPFTEVAPGALGPTVRAVVPITDPDGAVVGLVAAGVKTSSVQTVIDARLPAIIVLTLVLMLAGALAAWLLDRHLRRATWGWGLDELAQRYAYTESVLNSLRVGLVLCDRRGNIVLYNDRAAHLLGVPTRHGPGFHSAPIGDDDLPPSVAALLRSRRTVRGEVHRTADRELLVSQEPAVPTPGRARNRPGPPGTVTTILDRTTHAPAAGQPQIRTESVQPQVRTEIG